MLITIKVLKQLRSALSSVASSHFEAVLFSTMYIIIFFGFLRVSEFAIERNKNGDNNEVVQFSNAKLTVSQCELIIPSSKTDKYANSVSLIFTPSNDRSICPVQAVKRFL